jgi:hypothetical protein
MLHLLASRRYSLGQQKIRERRLLDARKAGGETWGDVVEWSL